jgi:hypothetical protein
MARDRFSTDPRHYMPGYYHLVPPGQNVLTSGGWPTITPLLATMPIKRSGLRCTQARTKNQQLFFLPAVEPPTADR